jgi:hypothetical protein
MSDLDWETKKMLSTLKILMPTTPEQEAVLSADLAKKNGYVAMLGAQPLAATPDDSGAELSRAMGIDEAKFRAWKGEPATKQGVAALAEEAAAFEKWRVGWEKERAEKAAAEKLAAEKAAGAAPSRATGTMALVPKFLAGGR